MYQLIRKYYNMGLYTKENVARFVDRGTLTEAQYREITGEDYSK